MGKSKCLNTIVSVELHNANITQRDFARRYSIPFRTVQNWCLGTTEPSPWLIPWIVEKIREMKGQQ